MGIGETPDATAEVTRLLNHAAAGGCASDEVQS
jgi:hypothetical protein